MKRLIRWPRWGGLGDEDEGIQKMIMEGGLRQE